MFTKMRVHLAALALLALAVPATSPAHEGHDHAPESLPPASSTAPRLEASSELFELVAIARGVELIVYVDRFRSNEPVAGAVLEIETPEGPRAAEAIGDAYRLPAPWLAKPGRHELIFTITLGDEVEILTGTLAVESPPPASGAGPQAGLMAAVASDLRRMVGANPTGHAISLPTLITGGIAGFVLGAATVLLLRNCCRF